MPGSGSRALSKLEQTGGPVALRRHKRRVEQEADLRAAYADVDRRDQGYCVVTGILTRPFAVDPKVRREHHHLAGRWVRPDWRHDPKRIVTVTAFVHQLIESGALELEGTDATRRIVAHWNRAIVAKGKEPFKLRSKRWSQNRDEV